MRGRKGIKYTLTDATELVDYVEQDLGRDPTKVWNLVDGATRLSQRSKYTDERTEMDRKAGRLLEVVF